MSELKPCPFCGSVEHLVNEEDAATIVCSVHTGGCGASTGYVQSDKKFAAELWNTRTPDTSAKVDDDRLGFIVETALQQAFNDFCSDTGCAPDCFTWNSKNLTADFSRGNFALNVANIIAKALEAQND